MECKNYSVSFRAVIYTEIHFVNAATYTFYEINLDMFQIPIIKPLKV